MGALDDLWAGVSGRSDARADVPTSKNFGYKKGGMAAERLRERGLGDESRARQLGLTDTIAARARGEGGPSVAELQMGRGLAQASAATANRAASARGSSRALAQSNMQAAQGNMASQNISNTGLLRAQEQIAAQELAQRGYGQVRSQDLQTRGLGTEESLGLEGLRQQAYGTNAGVGQGNAGRSQGIYQVLGAAAIGGVAASDVKHKEIIDRGMPSDFSKKEVYSDYTLKEPVPGAQPVTGIQGLPLEMQGLNVPEAPTDVEAEAAQQYLDRLREERQGPPQMAVPEGGGTASNVATGFNMGAALGGALSDFRAKEITPARSREDLDDVIPTDYRYKPEASIRMAHELSQGASPQARPEIEADVYEDKRAPRQGIVAQDLQRSPAFRDSVVQGEAGLAVDRDRALSTALYELGGLDKRLKALEGGGNGGMESDFDLKEPARIGEVGSMEARSLTDTPEIRQDFDELAAMLKAREPQRGGGALQRAAPRAPSQAEMYVSRVMQGSPQSQAPTYEPRSEVVRDESGGGGEVLVQDYGMKSDYTLKEPLRRGIPRARLGAMQSLLQNSRTRQDPEIERRLPKSAAPGDPDDAAKFIGREHQARGAKGRTDDPENRRYTIRSASKYLKGKQSSDLFYYPDAHFVLDVLNTDQGTEKPRKLKKPFTYKEVFDELRSVEM